MFTQKEILPALLDIQFRMEGNKNLLFTGFKAINESNSDCISWIRPKLKNTADLINSTAAGCIICNEEDYKLYNGSLGNKLFIINDTPQLAFIRLLNEYIRQTALIDVDAETIPLIHPTAIIHKRAKIGKNVKIGAYCIIEDCEIGDNTIIHEHVKIFNLVKIGTNCLIREFCSIGGPGFGIVKNNERKNILMPHIGTVIIENDVMIFPFSNVDCGTLGETRIGTNTAIDHYCHIGHNTLTGRNTIITAQVVMAGGSQIGNNCFIGVNTFLKDKIKIGDSVTTGAGAVVTQNIPDNEVWAGVPAKKLQK